MTIEDDEDWGGTPQAEIDRAYHLMEEHMAGRVKTYPIQPILDEWMARPGFRERYEALKVSHDASCPCHRRTDHRRRTDSDEVTGSDTK